MTEPQTDVLGMIRLAAFEILLLLALFPDTEHTRVMFIPSWYSPSNSVSTMSLNVEPAVGNFPATGGNATHNIISLVDTKLAFKVRRS